MSQGPLQLKLFGLGVAGTLWFCCSGVKAADPPPARYARIEQLRQFGVIEGDSVPRRCIRGVASFCNPDGNELCLQDESAGVLVRLSQRANFELGVGQLLEIEGTVFRSGGTLELRAGLVHLLGEAPLPTHEEASYQKMGSGELDWRYCQFIGVVRSIGQSRSDGLLPIDVGVSGGRVTALIKNYHLADCQKLIDAEVRISGVCSRVLDDQNRLQRITFRVPGMGSIAVDKPAPSDPFSIEQSETHQLAASDFRPSHRIRLRGIVSFQQPGRCFYMETNSKVICVESPQSTLLRPGDIVDVLGFSALGTTSPFVLEDASFLKAGTGPAPEPIRITPQTVLDDRHLGRIVELEAVAATSPDDDKMELQLSATKPPLRLRLRMGSTEPMPRLAVGSRLKVVGLCTKETDGTITILLRSPANIVMTGSPVSAKLLTFVSILVLIIVLLALSWGCRGRRTT